MAAFGAGSAAWAALCGCQRQRLDRHRARSVETGVPAAWAVIRWSGAPRAEEVLN